MMAPSKDQQLVSRRSLSDRVGGFFHALKEVVYGMTVYEFDKHASHERAELNKLFVLVTFGDLVGLPLLPSYYAMRLLPYIVPQIETWKRVILRERAPFESEEYDLIEM